MCKQQQKKHMLQQELIDKLPNVCSPPKKKKKKIAAAVAAAAGAVAAAGLGLQPEN